MENMSEDTNQLSDNQVNISLSTKQAVLAAGIVGLLIGGTAVAFFAGAQTNQAATNVQETTKNESTTSENNNLKVVSVSGLDIANEPTIGAENAPVTVVWFSDFNCMYCRQFAQDTFPEIRKNYIDTGRIKVVKKDFITMGDDSYVLARASQVIWQMVGKESPELYWQWANKISENQPTRKSNSKSVIEDIISTTREINGINVNLLQEKINSIGKNEINEDIKEGTQRGISGTPGFIIYKTGSNTGTTVSGALPYTAFQQVLDQLLKSGEES